jgi:hypothetical protein
VGTFFVYSSIFGDVRLLAGPSKSYRLSSRDLTISLSPQKSVENAGFFFCLTGVDPQVYLTIPAIAGLLNWATNQLAVWMIFNPQEFSGLPLVSSCRDGFV